MGEFTLKGVIFEDIQDLCGESEPVKMGRADTEATVADMIEMADVFAAGATFYYEEA